MAELQTSYSNTIAKGYAGMVANGETSNRITRTIEDAAGIAFGVPVYRGSGDHGCTATVGTLATFLGFTIAGSGRRWCRPDGRRISAVRQRRHHDERRDLRDREGRGDRRRALTVGKGGGAADLIGVTAADATHIATGWVADETVTDGICRIVKR
jgi:hypothetical protein